MKWSTFTTVRTACAYFFICPGLSYGLLTSRLPALKTQIGANEAQIGIILLCLGLSGLGALLGSAWLIARWGSRAILRLGSCVLLIALPLCGLASTPFTLGLACILVGLGTGLTDVSMNTQGIQIERRYRVPCMSLMHASYSFGGVLGSLTGALFAGMGFSPFVNFICILGAYVCFRPLAVPHLQKEMPIHQTTQQNASSMLPLFVIGCGLLAMFTYSAEGSVAEWGSLLLFTVKGASEHTAALAFGAFSATTVLCRFFGDRLRSYLGDFPLAFGGALLATCGMALALFSPRPDACLIGYACMGAGLSPLVPILFSRAGEYPGVTPGKASAAISVLAYGGLLFFPPTLGWLAHDIGLDKALLVVLALCCLLTAGTFLLRSQPKRASRPEQTEA